MLLSNETYPMDPKKWHRNCWIASSTVSVTLRWWILFIWGVARFCFYSVLPVKSVQSASTRENKRFCSILFCNIDMKYSVAYRGSTLWNTVTYRHNGLANRTRYSDLRWISPSTCRFRLDEFVYMYLTFRVLLTILYLYFYKYWFSCYDPISFLVRAIYVFTG